jgi:hypothetical protein
MQHGFKDRICCILPPMTLITFLSYLFKFLSNQALLTALLAMIQKILHP